MAFRRRCAAGPATDRSLSSPAEAMIVFFGDGGALVLAIVLMATFYAPRESRLYKSWGLRWGLLGIGALTFMHVFLLWRGPLEIFRSARSKA